ncbi:hypothetical protein K466DRAFT_332045 [Polyporus arcularius HHB13444]|uniref:Uncharacterized protein n=1 Tax=Polyporus arcularius HHB13444 TaxID=1314778 RepID=A0A5C3PPJ5_9APHY|nr:hypothetical protein K466DRAFT_332045 [Polyporus arcularius HHB13444]
MASTTPLRYPRIPRDTYLRLVPFGRVGHTSSSVSSHSVTRDTFTLPLPRTSLPPLCPVPHFSGRGFPVLSSVLYPLLLTLLSSRSRPCYAHDTRITCCFCLDCPCLATASASVRMANTSECCPDLPRGEGTVHNHTIGFWTRRGALFHVLISWVATQRYRIRICQWMELRIPHVGQVRSWLPQPCASRARK